MSVSFYQANSIKDCMLCHQSMRNSEVVAHDFQNTKVHAFHKSCLLTHVDEVEDRPTCHHVVELRSLYSTSSERSARTFSLVMRDAFRGAAVGMLSNAFPSAIAAYFGLSQKAQDLSLFPSLLAAEGLFSIKKQNHGVNTALGTFYICYNIRLSCSK